MKRNSSGGPLSPDRRLHVQELVGFGDKDLQFRVEVVNLFNNVNLGNPEAESDRHAMIVPNAGRINSTAYWNADPQRIFQFAVKFQF